MSPFLRGKVWWGRVSDRDGARVRVSMRTHDRTTAERLEGMLDALADQHRWTTLTAIAEGELSLGEAWNAYARGAVAQLERDLQDGTRGIDIAPLVAQWEKAMARRGRPSAPLQKKYVMQVRRLIPGDALFPLTDFTTPKLAAWLQALEVGQPNRYQAALSRFARFLIERGHLTQNPLAFVERAKEHPPKIVELTRAEVVRLLGCLTAEDRPMHALMSATGAEWGAVVSARASDLDLQALTFRARGTKTATRDRVVSLRVSEELDILRAYVKRAPGLHDAPLFPKLSHRSALDRLTKACEAAGVRRLTIHDWRHVYAVQAVRDGMPYYLIANQLGHSNTIMVQRVYGRFKPTADDFRMQKADTLKIAREG